MTRTNALESVVIAGFVRGLSVRDVEASLADALRPDSTVSKSSVRWICEVNSGGRRRGAGRLALVELAPGSLPCNPGTA